MPQTSPLLRPILRHMIICVILLGIPYRVGAQERPTASIARQLVVTIRDDHDSGIAHAQVLVRDIQGRTLLAQALTNEMGIAVGEGVAVNQVRILIKGTLPNGISLSQKGMDAQGIALFLDGSVVQLDLRVERDGMVVPDPVTMISPDLIGDITPVSGELPHVSAREPNTAFRSGVPTALPLPVPAVDEPAPVNTQHRGWWLIVIVLSIVTSGGLFIYWKRGQR